MHEPEPDFHPDGDGAYVLPNCAGIHIPVHRERDLAVADEPGMYGFVGTD